MYYLNNHTLLNGTEEHILYCFGTSRLDSTITRLSMLIGACTDVQVKAHLRALYDKLTPLTDKKAYTAAFRALRERLRPEMERQMRFSIWMETLALHQIQADTLDSAFRQLAEEDDNT